VDVESANLLTSLVAIGHLAQLYPSLFAQSTRNIVSRFVIKELLMQVRVSFALLMCTFCSELWIHESLHLILACYCPCNFDIRSGTLYL